MNTVNSTENMDFGENLVHEMESIHIMDSVTSREENIDIEVIPASNVENIDIKESLLPKMENKHIERVHVANVENYNIQEYPSINMENIDKENLVPLSKYVQNVEILFSRLENICIEHNPAGKEDSIDIEENPVYEVESIGIDESPTSNVGNINIKENTAMNAKNNDMEEIIMDNMENCASEEKLEYCTDNTDLDEIETFNYHLSNVKKRLAHLLPELELIKTLLIPSSLSWHIVLPESSQLIFENHFKTMDCVLSAIERVLKYWSSLDDSKTEQIKDFFANPHENPILPYDVLYYQVYRVSELVRVLKKFLIKNNQ